LLLGALALWGLLALWALVPLVLTHRVVLFDERTGALTLRRGLRTADRATLAEVRYAIGDAERGGMALIGLERDGDADGEESGRRWVVPESGWDAAAFDGLRILQSPPGPALPRPAAGRWRRTGGAAASGAIAGRRPRPTGAAGGRGRAPPCAAPRRAGAGEPSQPPRAQPSRARVPARDALAGGVLRRRGRVPGRVRPGAPCARRQGAATGRRPASLTHLRPTCARSARSGGRLRRRRVGPARRRPRCPRRPGA